MRHTAASTQQQHAIGMDVSGNGNCPVIMAHGADCRNNGELTSHADAWQEDDNLLTIDRDIKRSKSLNNDSVPNNLIDNAKVRRRTASDSDDPICLRNGIFARNKRLGRLKSDESVEYDTLDRNDMIMALNKLSNVGAGNYNDQRDKEKVQNSRDENRMNVVTWKSLSPKESFKDAARVSSGGSSESDTVIESKLEMVVAEGTKMSCDSPVTCSSSASSSPLHRSKVRSEKNSVASDENFNNSYFYDEDFQVQFDTNIREQSLDVQEDSILDFSDAFSDELVSGSFNINQEERGTEMSSEDDSVAMTCSSDMQLSTGPLFTTTTCYDGPLHNFSTDSLDHEHYLLTASATGEAINLHCQPKKENYMLSFSGYSDKRGSSDGSIPSDSSYSSVPITKTGIDNHHYSDPMVFDSPPSQSSSNNTKDSASSHRPLINKWATRRNLISPSMSQGDTSRDNSQSSGSLTCWNNIKANVTATDTVSVPKSSSLDEVRKMSQSPHMRQVISFGDIKGRQSASPVPSSLFDIYRHSHGESSYEDALERVDTSDYAQLGFMNKRFQFPSQCTESNGDLCGVKTLVQCQSAQGTNDSQVPHTYKRSLSSPGNRCIHHPEGHHREKHTQVPQMEDKLEFIPWSGTKNFASQFPPHTKDCGIQTSMIASANRDSTKPPPRSQSCPQNLSCEFDEFLSQHLLHRSQSLIKWMPTNAESVYRNVFECQTPFVGGLRKRGCSSSPMRPVKASFYSHHCHKSLPDLTFLEVPLNPDHLKQAEAARGRSKTKLLHQTKQNLTLKTVCCSQQHASSHPHTLQTRSKSLGSLTDKMNIRGPIPPKSSNTIRNSGKIRPQDLAASSGASSSSSGIDPGYYEYNGPICYSNFCHSNKQRFMSANCFSSGCMHYDVPPVQVMCCCGGYESKPQVVTPQNFDDALKTYAVPKQKSNMAVVESGSLGNLYAVNEETTPTTTPENAGKEFFAKAASEDTKVSKDDGDDVSDDSKKISGQDEKPLKSCLRKDRQDFAAARRCQSICGPLQRNEFLQVLSCETKKCHRHSYAFDDKPESNDDFTWMLNHALEIPTDLRCATDSRDLSLTSVRTTFHDGCPDDLAGSKFTLSSSGGNTSEDSEKKEKRKSVSFASEISVHKTANSPDTHSQNEPANARDTKASKQVNNGGSSSDKPPNHFRATSPLTSIQLTKQENHARKIRFLSDVSSAAKCLVSHFAKGRQPYQKLRLGNLTETPQLGHIILSRLCPAVARVISDGLRGHVTGVNAFARVSLSVWRVAQVSVELGGTNNDALSDLIRELRDRADLVSTRQRFEAFIFGLLNLRMLDAWLGQVREKESIMLRFYEPTALLCESHDQLLGQYDDTIMSLQLLTVLPFQLDYSYVVSYHTSQLSRDVDDIYLENKYSELRTNEENENEVKNCAVAKPDGVCTVPRCAKDFWKMSDQIPAVVSHVKKRLTPGMFQRDSKRRWSFSHAIFGMSQSTPLEEVEEGQIARPRRQVNERKKDSRDVGRITGQAKKAIFDNLAGFAKTGKRMDPSREDLLKMVRLGKGGPREMVMRRHSDNSDVEKKTPPPKPKRLSKSERELLQSLDEFRVDREKVGTACGVGGDLIDLSDEGVFADDKTTQADYVNVPSPEMKVGQTIGELGHNCKEGQGKVVHGDEIGHCQKVDHGDDIGHCQGVGHGDGSDLLEKDGVKFNDEAENGRIKKSESMKMLALEKKVCRVFADKLGKYESGIPMKIGETTEPIDAAEKIVEKDIKHPKPSKLPIFSPVKRNGAGNTAKNVNAKRNVVQRSPIHAAKSGKVSSSARKTSERCDRIVDYQKAPSKLIKLFDKILPPRGKVPEPKVVDRWSWSGGASGTGSKIPSLKVKGADKSEASSNTQRNRFGYQTRDIQREPFVTAAAGVAKPPKPTSDSPSSPKNSDLDISLCDIADALPAPAVYDDIDDAPISREIDGNANFLAPAPSRMKSGPAESSDQTKWDSFKKPDYQYVTTRADSPVLSDPDCAEMPYERGDTLQVLAQLNDDWLYCGDAHHEGLVRVHSVDPIN